MSKFKTGLVAAAVLAGGVAVGYGAFGGDDPEADGTRHLVNQVWIERVPDGPRDMIGHFALIKHPRGNFGAVGRSSQWRHLIEGLMWKLEGSRLSLYFPQEESKTAVKARTWNCEDEAPAPFQLCLEVSARGGSRTFYSRKDWVIDVDNVEGSLESMVEENPELAGVFEQAVAAESAPTGDLDSFTSQDQLPNW